MDGHPHRFSSPPGDVSLGFRWVGVFTTGVPLMKLFAWGVSGVNQSSSNLLASRTPVPSRYTGQGRDSKPWESGVKHHGKGVATISRMPDVMFKRSRLDHFHCYTPIYPSTKLSLPSVGEGDGALG